MSTRNTTQPYSHWLYKTLDEAVALKYPHQINNGSIKSVQVKLYIFLDNNILLLTPSNSEKLVLISRDATERKDTITTIVEGMLIAQIKEDELSDLQYLDLIGNEPLVELQSSYDGHDESVIKDRAVLTVLLSASASSVTAGSAIDGTTYGPITIASILADGSGVSIMGRTVADQEGVRKSIAGRRQYIAQQQQSLTADAHVPVLHNFSFATIYATVCLRAKSRSLEYSEIGFLLKEKGIAGPWLYILPCSLQEMNMVMQGTIPQEIQHRRRKADSLHPDGESWTDWSQYEVLGAFGMIYGIWMNGGRQEYRRVLSGQTGRLHLAWLQSGGSEYMRILP